MPATNVGSSWGLDRAPPEGDSDIAESQPPDALRVRSRSGSTSAARRRVVGRWEALAALPTFLAFAGLLLLPVLSEPSGLVPGDLRHPGVHGELFHQWDLLESFEAGNLTRPYHSTRIAHPAGEDLTPTIGISLHLALYLALSWVDDIFLRYNLLVLLALGLNGFCAWLLCRDLTRSWWPALAGGVMFMLCPYAMLKLHQGFPQKLFLCWVPLYLMWLLRFLRWFRARDAVLAGLAWGGMLLTYPQYGLYGALAVPLLLVLRWGDRGVEWKRMLSCGWPMGVPGLAAVLLLASALGLVGGYRAEPAVLSAAGSVDLCSPFRFSPFPVDLSGVELLPLGSSLIAALLAIAAVVSRGGGRGATLILAVLGGFYFLVTLGPFVRCGDQTSSLIPLPYWFLVKVLPRMERLGYAFRALPFVEISLAALAALAATKLARSRSLSFAGRGASMLIAVSLVGAVALERRLLLPELFPPKLSSTRPGRVVRWLEGSALVLLHLPDRTARLRDRRFYCFVTARTGSRMVNLYDQPHPVLRAPDLRRSSVEEVRRLIERARGRGAQAVVLHPWPRTGRAGGRSSTGTGTARHGRPFRLLRRLLGPPAAQDPAGMAVFAIPSAAKGGG